MYKKLSRKYIEDMLEYLNDALEIAYSVKNLEEFTSSKTQYYAIVRCLEVVGEAANKIPQHIILRYPNVEWKKIIATRNRLIHGYDSISYSTVWSIVHENLPELKRQLENILNDQELDNMTIL